MTERELSYIKTIAELRSFSKASQELFVSQPSLSQCVSNVEKELGTPLFIRGSKGLALTEAGERYYKTACEILRVYDDFLHEVSEFNELKRGKIRLGIPTHLSLIVLPAVLPRFMQMHPGIQVELVEKNSTELEPMLCSSQIDFAIIHTIPQYESAMDNVLEYQVLRREPFVIVLPHGDPAGKHSRGIDDRTNLPMLDLRCLREHPFLLVMRSNRLRMFIDYIMEQAQFKPNVILTTRNYEAAHRLACAGMGATLIPWEYQRTFSDNVQANYYALPETYNSVWETSIATARGSYLSRASRAFIDLTLETFGVPLNPYL